MTRLAPEQDPQVWNAVADKYAKHLDPMTGLFAAEAVRLAAPKAGEAMLDLACGAGAVTFPAAQSGAKVLAVDIAPAFVEMVTRRAGDAGLANVTARVMDGQALDVADGSFDVAVSNFGVFLFPQRAKGLREMHRVLKPGGRAVVTSFAAPPDNEWMAFFGQSVRRAFPDDPPPPPPSFLELADPERLRREVLEAGFQEVEVETQTRAATWADVDVAWAALAEGAPVFRRIIERVGEDGVKALRVAFDALAEERFGKGAPVTLGAPVHFALARKAP